MDWYRVKLLKKSAVAEGTFSFYFSKPKNFNFKAGQYIEMLIENMHCNDEKGNRRYFSIASAPDEDYLMFAMRMRESAFKKTLMELSVEEEVRISEPKGNFVLHDDASKPSVFLAGGIGITPFRSIIHNVIKNKLSHKIYLFYANKNLSSAAFLDELQKIGKYNNNFTLIPVFSQESLHNTKYEQGRINIDMIKKYSIPTATSIFYISGTPSMVFSLSKHLEENQIPAERIKTDGFAGY